jgi:hypothetical protein
MMPFLLLAAEKKTSFFWTSQTNFGPSYIVRALSVGNFDQFLTPSPLPIADVVYGRPPKYLSKQEICDMLIYHFVLFYIFRSDWP